MFADGALGPHTAAMLQPYEGTPQTAGEQNTGILLLDNEQIFEYGQQAAAHGISMAIHAIGDRANREILDLFVKCDPDLRLHRFRVEHAVESPAGCMLLVKITAAMPSPARRMGTRPIFSFSSWQCATVIGVCTSTGVVDRSSVAS